MLKTDLTFNVSFVYLLSQATEKTPLMMAVEGSHVQIVTMFLEAKASVDVRDKVPEPNN